MGGVTPVYGVGYMTGIPRIERELPGIFVVKFIGKATQLPQPNPQESPFAISCILLSISAQAEAENPRETRRFDGSIFAEKSGLFTSDVPSHIFLYMACLSMRLISAILSGILSLLASVSRPISEGGSSA